LSFNWDQSNYLIKPSAFVLMHVSLSFFSIFWLQLVEATFLVVKTDGEAQQKAVDQVYEKLNVLENGMKTYLAERDAKVESNFGIVEIVFSALFGCYKAHEEVLGTKFIVPEKFPVLFSWLMGIAEVEAVKKATPPHEKVVGILQLFRQSALKSSAAAWYRLHQFNGFSIIICFFCKSWDIFQ